MQASQQKDKHEGFFHIGLGNQMQNGLGCQEHYFLFFNQFKRKTDVAAI